MKNKIEKISLVHQKEHDKAAEVAEYYSLDSIETPVVERLDILTSKG